jgi:hypothetical protein
MALKDWVLPVRPHK